MVSAGGSCESRVSYAMIELTVFWILGWCRSGPDRQGQGAPVYRCLFYVPNRKQVA